MGNELGQLSDSPLLSGQLVTSTAFAKTEELRSNDESSPTGISPEHRAQETTAAAFKKAIEMQLTAAEREHINQVLSRVRQLEEREDARVAKLVGELQHTEREIRRRVSTSNQEITRSNPMCTLCGRIEVVSGANGGGWNVCSDCERNVCSQCGSNFGKPEEQSKLWLCNFCQKRRRVESRPEAWLKSKVNPLEQLRRQSTLRPKRSLFRASSFTEYEELRNNAGNLPPKTSSHQMVQNSSVDSDEYYPLEHQQSLLRDEVKASDVDGTTYFEAVESKDFKQFQTDSDRNRLSSTTKSTSGQSGLLTATEQEIDNKHVVEAQEITGPFTVAGEVTRKNVSTESTLIRSDRIREPEKLEKTISLQSQSPDSVQNKREQQTFDSVNESSEIRNEPLNYNVLCVRCVCNAVPQPDVVPFQAGELSFKIEYNDAAEQEDSSGLLDNFVDFHLTNKQRCEFKAGRSSNPLYSELNTEKFKRGTSSPSVSTTYDDSKYIRTNVSILYTNLNVDDSSSIPERAFFISENPSLGNNGRSSRDIESLPRVDNQEQISSHDKQTPRKNPFSTFKSHTESSEENSTSLSMTFDSSLGDYSDEFEFSYDLNPMNSHKIGRWLPELQSNRETSFYHKQPSSLEKENMDNFHTSFAGLTPSTVENGGLNLKETTEHSNLKRCPNYQNIFDLSDDKQDIISNRFSPQPTTVYLEDPVNYQDEEGEIIPTDDAPKRTWFRSTSMTLEYEEVSNASYEDAVWAEMFNPSCTLVESAKEISTMLDLMSSNEEVLSRTLPSPGPQESNTPDANSSDLDNLTTAVSIQCNHTESGLNESFANHMGTQLIADQIDAVDGEVIDPPAIGMETSPSNRTIMPNAPANKQQTTEPIPVDKSIDNHRSTSSPDVKSIKPLLLSHKVHTTTASETDRPIELAQLRVTGEEQMENVGQSDRHIHLKRCSYVSEPGYQSGYDTELANLAITDSIGQSSIEPRVDIEWANDNARREYTDKISLCDEYHPSQEYIESVAIPNSSIKDDSTKSVDDRSIRARDACLSEYDWAHFPLLNRELQPERKGIATDFNDRSNSSTDGSAFRLANRAFIRDSTALATDVPGTESSEQKELLNPDQRTCPGYFHFHNNFCCPRITRSSPLIFSSEHQEPLDINNIITEEPKEVPAIDERFSAVLIRQAYANLNTRSSPKPHPGSRSVKHPVNLEQIEEESICSSGLEVTMSFNQYHHTKRPRSTSYNLDGYCQTTDSGISETNFDRFACHSLRGTSSRSSRQALDYQDGYERSFRVPLNSPVGRSRKQYSDVNRMWNEDISLKNSPNSIRVAAAKELRDSMLREDDASYTSLRNYTPPERKNTGFGARRSFMKSSVEDVNNRYNCQSFLLNQINKTKRWIPKQFPSLSSDSECSGFREKRYTGTTQIRSKFKDRFSYSPYQTLDRKFSPLFHRHHYSTTDLPFEASKRRTSSLLSKRYNRALENASTKAKLSKSTDYLGPGSSYSGGTSMQHLRARLAAAHSEFQLDMEAQPLIDSSLYSNRSLTLDRVQTQQARRRAERQHLNLLESLYNDEAPDLLLQSRLSALDLHSRPLQVQSAFGNLCADIDQDLILESHTPTRPLTSSTLAPPIFSTAAVRYPENAYYKWLPLAHTSRFFNGDHLNEPLEITNPNVLTPNPIRYSDLDSTLLMQNNLIPASSDSVDAQSRMISYNQGLQNLIDLSSGLNAQTSTTDWNLTGEDSDSLTIAAMAGAMAATAVANAGLLEDAGQIDTSNLLAALKMVATTPHAENIDRASLLSKLSNLNIDRDYLDELIRQIQSNLATDSTQQALAVLLNRSDHEQHTKHVPIYVNQDADILSPDNHHYRRGPDSGLGAGPSELIHSWLQPNERREPSENRVHHLVPHADWPTFSTNQTIQPNANETKALPKRVYDFPTKKVLLMRDQKSRQKRINGIGMQIVGGHLRSDGRLGAFVERIDPQGPIDQLHGEIAEGDEILEWNSITLVDKTFEEVHAIIQQATEEIELLVRARAGDPRRHEYCGTNTEAHENHKRCIKRVSALCHHHAAQQALLDLQHAPICPHIQHQFASLSSEDSFPQSSQAQKSAQCLHSSSTGSDSVISAEKKYSFRHTTEKAELSLPESTGEYFKGKELEQLSSGNTQQSQMDSPVLNVHPSDFNDGIQERKSSLNLTRRGSGKRKGSKADDTTEVSGEIELILTFDDYDQSLTVHIARARGLPPMDLNGLADPFVKVRLHPDPTEDPDFNRQTKYMSNTLTPEWQQTVVFMNCIKRTLKRRVLEVTVWDFDRLKTNDFMGQALINLGDKNLVDGKPHWYTLHKMEPVILPSAKKTPPPPRPYVHEGVDHLKHTPNPRDPTEKKHSKSNPKSGRKFPDVSSK